MKSNEQNHLKGYTLINCQQSGENTISGKGVFGLARDIRLVEKQKVYVRAIIEADNLARAYVGILDSGKLYEQRKGLGRGRTQLISVVHTCRSTDIGIRIIIDGLGESREIKVKGIVFKPVANTKVLKRTLDKIPYSESGYDNIYDDPEQDKSLLGIVSTESVTKREIKCSRLEKGKQYYIKVLVEELTDCGTITLDCGVSSQTIHENEMMQRFVYVKGKNPVITLKAHKYAYIVWIKAIMIAEATDITMKDFADNNYFVNRQRANVVEE